MSLVSHLAICFHVETEKTNFLLVKKTVDKFLPFKEFKKIIENMYASSKILYSTFKLGHKGKSPNEINLPFKHTNGLAQEVHEVITVRGP